MTKSITFACLATDRRTEAIITQSHQPLSVLPTLGQVLDMILRPPIRDRLGLRFCRVLEDMSVSHLPSLLFVVLNSLFSFSWPASHHACLLGGCSPRRRLGGEGPPGMSEMLEWCSSNQVHTPMPQSARLSKVGSAMFCAAGEAHAAKQESVYGKN